MASYLQPDPDRPLFGVSALKLWLKGDITTPGFLSSNNGGYIDKGGRDQFSLQELQRALYIAILEISLKLDPELECVATQASGVKYCIAVDVDEFYEGRDAEVKSLVDLDSDKRDEVISEYDRDAVCEVLEQTREEIGWLENQIRRLGLHMETAEAMKRARSRNGFVFRPLERDWAVSRGGRDVEMPDADADAGWMDGGDGEYEEMSEVETKEVEGMPAREGGNASEEREKRIRKERLELFKREADVGFGSGKVEETLEEGEVREKSDSPLVGLGVKNDRKIADKH